jgi:uncharacterized integral membrane protein
MVGHYFVDCHTSKTSEERLRVSKVSALISVIFAIVALIWVRRNSERKTQLTYFFGALLGISLVILLGSFLANH